MKNGNLLTSVLLIFIFAACSKNNSLAPVNNTNPYLNKYTGTYSGEFFESNNGVDSNGVFKRDTSYTMVLTLLDGGDYSFTVDKGPLVISSNPVDSTGHFSFVDYNRNIYGHFVNDSLYMACKALNGSYNYPQWFVIQQMSFAGKKQF